MYLELLKQCLLGFIYQDSPIATFGASGLDLAPKGGFDPALRALGDDWPSKAHTMIGAQ